MAQLTIVNDEVELAARAAERVTQVIDAAVAASGRATVSLTGGTTPRRLYANLADLQQPWHTRIPWPQVQLFWGDERHVPPGHPDSNYGMAKAELLDHVPIPADHVHRMRGELPDAHDAAADYERVIARVASGVSRKDSASGFRRTHLFDLMLLGVGDDAHIASIFPGSTVLDRNDRRRAAAVWAAHLDSWRITLTPGAILDSHTILVLVAGANKADAVLAAMREPRDVKKYPVHLLRTAGDRVEWFLDRPAASKL